MNNVSLLVCTDAGITTESCAVCETVGTLAECRYNSDAETSAGRDGGQGGRGGTATPEISVNVTFGDSPLSGANVVFHDAAGQPSRHLQTDGEGTASASSGQISIVTVAIEKYVSGAPQYALHSWFDVHPGDELRLNYPSGMDKPPDQRMIDVSFPGPVDGAHTYLARDCVGGSIGSPTKPATVYADASCINLEGLINVLATAEGEGGRLAYTFASITQQAWIDMTAVHLSGWRFDFDVIDFEFQNATSAGTLATGVSLFDHGVPIDRLFFGDVPVEGGSGNTTSARFPKSIGDSLLFDVSLKWVDGASSLSAAAPRQARTQRIDLRELLPRVRGVSLDLSDENRPQVRWTTSDEIVNAESGHLVVTWQDHMWFFTMAPHSDSPVQFPALPNALRDWRPFGATYKPPIVYFVDDSNTESWNDARQGIIRFAKPKPVVEQTRTLRVTSAGPF